jgi:hypothetical protein
MNDDPRIGKDVEESGSYSDYLVHVVFNDSLNCSGYTAMTVKDLERTGEENICIKRKGRHIYIEWINIALPLQAFKYCLR